MQKTFITTTNESRTADATRLRFAVFPIWDIRQAPPRPNSNVQSGFRLFEGRSPKRRFLAIGGTPAGHFLRDSLG